MDGICLYLPVYTLHFYCLRRSSERISLGILVYRSVPHCGKHLIMAIPLAAPGLTACQLRWAFASWREKASQAQTKQTCVLFGLNTLL